MYYCVFYHRYQHCCCFNSVPSYHMAPLCSVLCCCLCCAVLSMFHSSNLCKGEVYYDGGEANGGVHRCRPNSSIPYSVRIAAATPVAAASTACVTTADGLSNNSLLRFSVSMEAATEVGCRKTEPSSLGRRRHCRLQRMLNGDNGIDNVSSTAIATPVDGDRSHG